MNTPRSYGSRNRSGGPSALRFARSLSFSACLGEDRYTSIVSRSMKGARTFAAAGPVKANRGISRDSRALLIVVKSRPKGLG